MSVDADTIRELVVAVVALAILIPAFAIALTVGLFRR
jgi:hypothetical protein